MQAETQAPQTSSGALWLLIATVAAVGSVLSPVGASRGNRGFPDALSVPAQTLWGTTSLSGNAAADMAPTCGHRALRCALDTNQHACSLARAA